MNIPNVYLSCLGCISIGIKISLYFLIIQIAPHYCDEPNCFGDLSILETIQGILWILFILFPFTLADLSLIFSKKKGSLEVALSSLFVILPLFLVIFSRFTTP